jgi:ADP-heptose:LPS heptosyltransferase
MLPIGDTLFVTPTLRALRTRYPDAQITALAYASNAPLLRTAASASEVVEMPAFHGVRSAAEYAHLLGRLRHETYDVAVDFTSPAFKWIGMGAGIARRTYMKFDRGWWLLPGRHEAWRGMHATRLYYECAAELDLPPWDAVDHRPWVDVPEPAHEEAAAFLARAGVGQPQRPVVAMHPGGKGLRGHKRWDPQRFAHVADALHARWGADIVLVGGRDEQPLESEVAGRTACPVVRAAGQLSLLGTTALLTRSDLFIGNDSSLLHLAACQGTPYVGIFGPTALANFQPMPLHTLQGRLAIAWPPSPRMGYFVGARPIWQLSTTQRDARAALDTITPDLVLGYANELLAERTAAAEATVGPITPRAPS